MLFGLYDETLQILVRFIWGYLSKTSKLIKEKRQILPLNTEERKGIALISGGCWCLRQYGTCPSSREGLQHGSSGSRRHSNGQRLSSSRRHFSSWRTIAGNDWYQRLVTLKWSVVFLQSAVLRWLAKVERRKRCKLSWCCKKSFRRYVQKKVHGC